jgi:hypothetical protein
MKDELTARNLLNPFAEAYIMNIKDPAISVPAPTATQE